MHDFLSPRRQRHQPTRIFLANTFLSNISLDGTHRDTKYRALAELYKKDEPSRDTTSIDQSETSENLESPPRASPSHAKLTPLRQTSAFAASTRKKTRSKNLRRSNSLRSKQSRLSSSSSSSSSSQRGDSGESSDDEEIQDREQSSKRRNDEPYRSTSTSSKYGTEAVQGEENDLVRSGKTPRKNRQRRSSSGSYVKPLRLDSVSKREKAFRTISGSSAESYSHRGAVQDAAFLRAESTSPNHTWQSHLSSSPPIFELKDGDEIDLMDLPNQMTLLQLFALPGEILDSHRGFITEKKEFMFTANKTSQWPIAQTSFISKYKLEQVDEEVVEKRDIPRHSLFPAPPQSLMQRISARLSRINSAGSVGSSKSGQSESPTHVPAPSQSQSGPISSSRRAWPWPSKARSQQENHQPIRPRRLSTVTSIHIETEAGALENLLGIKLTSDPDDELSYENMLVPLAWNIDHIGDLTPEEAKNLLNTGEISVVSKLIGPAHPNSFDENYAFSKLFRRDPNENRQRYYSITSQTSDRSSSQEPMSTGERQFAQDGYRPGILEDPEWETAVRRTNLYLDSYFSSIIANDLEPEKKKEALNELFRGKFAYIQLSFSKFRSIKKDMQKACTDHGVRLDLAVVALSYVYFEKLVLRGFINKPNRKILACVCVVLAAKMSDLTKDEHGELFSALQSQLRVERSEINAFEFAVTVALGFDLHVPVRYVRYHYDVLSRKNEELPSVYAIPLQEPVQTKQRLSLNINPIRQISWTGLSRFANHRVNAARPHPRRK